MCDYLHPPERDRYKKCPSVRPSRATKRRGQVRNETARPHPENGRGRYATNVPAHPAGGVTPQPPGRGEALTYPAAQRVKRCPDKRRGRTARRKCGRMHPHRGARGDGRRADGQTDHGAGQRHAGAGYKNPAAARRFPFKIFSPRSVRKKSYAPFFRPAKSKIPPQYTKKTTGAG